MKRRFRLTRTQDFERVRRLGRSYAHPLVVLIAFPNQIAQTRIGVSAGRAVGGAVQRNRAKRILRAAVVPLMSSIPPGYDIALLARRKILGEKSTALQPVIASLLKKANILPKP
ncbi:MAG: ribonuclease P protein component [Anaerolineae bacterium]|nr:ribonuclease P protein component [Anaerolineae bacterium]